MTDYPKYKSPKPSVVEFAESVKRSVPRIPKIPGLDIAEKLKKDMHVAQRPELRIDLESMYKRKREKEAVDLGFAHVLYERLMREIQEFESTLKPDEEVAGYLASFGDKILIQIERVGFQNPYFIVLHGWIAESGQKIRLVQHTSQINILFTAVKVSPEERRKPRRIGFFSESEKEGEQENGGKNGT